MNQNKPCPECGQNNLYSAMTNSRGGYGPDLLPGLSRFLISATFKVVTCADCGLTRFYAAEEARKKIPSSQAWRKL
ncbi:MAG: hypothetical protein RL616_507 [Verrucomicrobiota bacterium]|jgi:predicted nucleic-acid-binding Zn-ribbon protein